MLLGTVLMIGADLVGGDIVLGGDDGETSGWRGCAVRYHLHASPIEPGAKEGALIRVTIRCGPHPSRIRERDSVQGTPNQLLLLPALARKTSMISWRASTKLSYDVSELSCMPGNDDRQRAVSQQRLTIAPALLV